MPITRNDKISTLSSAKAIQLQKGLFDAVSKEGYGVDGVAALVAAWNKVNPLGYDLVTATAAEVIAMNTTEIEVVAAPGADKWICPLFCFGSIDFGSAAFDGSNTDVLFEYSGGTAVSLFAAALAASADAGFSGVATLDVSEVENQSIRVTEGGGNPATGDSTISLGCVYLTLDI
jgi:hypothetical protein